MVGEKSMPNNIAVCRNIRVKHHTYSSSWQDHEGESEKQSSTDFARFVNCTCDLLIGRCIG
eukprot:scaffold320_cov335-Pavlova_lutheri.AAC.19